MQSTDTRPLWRPAIVYAFPADWIQAHETARRCGAAMGELEVHKFPDNESLITVAPHEKSAGGVVALYRSLQEPDAKLMETLLAAAAIRANGAARVILIAPYLPYMRQDRAFAPGQAVSQSVLGAILDKHFDAVVTIQPHLHRTTSLQSIFPTADVLVLGAGAAIARDIRAWATPTTVIAGPDEESAPLVADVANSIGATWFTAEKQRHGDRDVQLSLPAGVQLQGRTVVIVDDIVSTGGTIAALARRLKEAGAGSIIVYAVHALFNHQATYQMRRAGVSKIKSVSGVPHTSNAVSVVDIIAPALGEKQ